MITEKKLLENENEPSCLGAVSVSVTYEVQISDKNLLKLGFKKIGNDEEYRFQFKEWHEGNIMDFITNWNTQDEKIIMHCKTRTFFKNINEFQKFYFESTGRCLTEH